MRNRIPVGHSADLSHRHISLQRHTHPWDAGAVRRQSHGTGMHPAGALQQLPVCAPEAWFVVIVCQCEPPEVTITASQQGMPTWAWSCPKPCARPPAPEKPPDVKGTMLRAASTSSAWRSSWGSAPHRSTLIRQAPAPAVCMATLNGACQT